MTFETLLFSHQPQQINENGILSFRSSFRSTFIRDFAFFFHFQPLIAPLWTDLNVNSGGSVYFREASDSETLERARNLTQEHFPAVDFEPAYTTIVTWSEVPHSFRSFGLVSGEDYSMCIMGLHL